jgi:hypothetical protein
MISASAVLGAIYNCFILGVLCLATSFMSGSKLSISADIIILGLGFSLQLCTEFSLLGYVVSTSRYSTYLIPDSPFLCRYLYLSSVGFTWGSPFPGM